MTITKKIEGANGTITLEGRLDTVTSPDFEAAVAEVASQVTDLVIDLKNLDYTSSAGLRVFLKAQKAMMQKGTLKITNVREEVMDIFDVTGFSDILDIS